jgi:hypothetical protein
MSNKKAIVFLISVILVFAGITTFITLKPSPQPQVTQPPVSTSPEKEIDVANWKIYRNKEYGFEVKYPPNYIFQHPRGIEFAHPPKFFGRFISQEGLIEEEECKKLATECLHLGFFVEIKDRNAFFSESDCDKTKTLNECIIEKCQTQPGATENELCGKFKIGNYEWTRAVWMGMFGIESFYIENNNLVYEFYTEEQEEEKVRVLHQILSTFKFIR